MFFKIQNTAGLFQETLIIIVKMSPFNFELQKFFRMFYLFLHFSDKLQTFQTNDRTTRIKS